MTKDKEAYIGASVAFKVACVGTFADGAGESVAGEGGGGGSAPWDKRIEAAPVDLIVAGNVIVVAIAVVVVVVSRNVGAEGRVGRATPPPVVAFVNVGGGGAGPDPAAERAPLNVALSHSDCFAAPVWCISPS